MRTCAWSLGQVGNGTGETNVHKIWEWGSVGCRVSIASNNKSSVLPSLRACSEGGRPGLVLALSLVRELELAIAAVGHGRTDVCETYDERGLERSVVG